MVQWTPQFSQSWNSPSCPTQLSAHILITIHVCWANLSTDAASRQSGSSLDMNVRGWRSRTIIWTLTIGRWRNLHNGFFLQQSDTVLTDFARHEHRLIRVNLVSFTMLHVSLIPAYLFLHIQITHPLHDAFKCLPPSFRRHCLQIIRCVIIYHMCG